MPAKAQLQPETTNTAQELCDVGAAPVGSETAEACSRPAFLQGWPEAMITVGFSKAYQYQGLVASNPFSSASATHFPRASSLLCAMLWALSGCSVDDRGAGGTAESDKSMTTTNGNATTGVPSTTNASSSADASEITPPRLGLRGPVQVQPGR